MNYKTNKDKTLFTVASETAKYTGINLAKEVRSVHWKLYMIGFFKKKVVVDTSKWKYTFGNKNKT